MTTTWHCPLPHCTEVVIESVPVIEALAIGYARGRHGELPDAVTLAALRWDRVTVALDEHLRSHPVTEISAWCMHIQ